MKFSKEEIVAFKTFKKVYKKVTKKKPMFNQKKDKNGNLHISDNLPPKPED